MNEISSKPQKISDNERRLLIDSHPEIKVVDERDRNLEELFLLRNPKYRFDKNYKDELNKFLEEYRGQINWFYLPWINTLVSYLEEDLHLELRTGRNKYLISKKEQEKFYNSTITEEEKQQIQSLQRSPIWMSSH